ncbi:signal peptidase I T [Clostridium homopropionicum DSM 5847]|uniref:Signal peptidase I n=1 Tax=Clostridium homopropionicum DSM 5847 TaxID=1121318 RepID=A0A0L6ZBS2_9CLOT|nr:signal peptidase I [Clostridium homopropionicum]KOA20407.1 signal peptidase I T [Clostridium homopropionicum DSM 5847]SFG75413.1 signal peptidase I [Clostridium homopropionicum]
MKDKKKLIKEINSWIFSILGGFLIAVLINSKVFAKVQVQQSSMENTLFTNQQLIVDKLSYNFKKPKRGDIIIFLEDGKKGTILDDALSTIDSIVSIFSNNKDYSEESKRLVKRVIGAPGDEVDIKDGYVYVNDEKLQEAYAKGETFTREFKLPVKVGENELFVLGDNRMVSMDSRKFGLINFKQVEGKAIFRVYPFNEIGEIK